VVACYRYFEEELTGLVGGLHEESGLSAVIFSTKWKSLCIHKKIKLSGLLYFL
jgi:hypothetical protein